MEVQNLAFRKAVLTGFPVLLL